MCLYSSSIPKKEKYLLISLTGQYYFYFKGFKLI